jgi:hypothetical protein
MGTPVSSTNKTDRHNIAEILLKVALRIITLTMTLWPLSADSFIQCTGNALLYSTSMEGILH